jgi:hypothetical protein
VPLQPEEEEEAGAGEADDVRAAGADFFAEPDAERAAVEATGAVADAVVECDASGTIEGRAAAEAVGVAAALSTPAAALAPGVTTLRRPCFAAREEGVGEDTWLPLVLLLPVSGASGGGTEEALTAAVDDNAIEASFFGSCGTSADFSGVCGRGAGAAAVEVACADCFFGSL